MIFYWSDIIVLMIFGMMIFIGATATGQRMAAYIIARLIIWLIWICKDEIDEWATNEITKSHQ